VRRGEPDDRKRAKWLIEKFLYEDPEYLSTGSRLDRRQEMVALVLLGVLGTSTPVGSGAALRLGPEGDLADPTELRAAWQQINGSIHRWARGETVELPAVSTVVSQPKERGKDLQARIVRMSGGLANSALFAAFDLLAHPDVRVRLCDVCNKLFVPVRRQERHEKCARQLRDAKRPERGKRKPKKGAK
jgi:hypothetical protein